MTATEATAAPEPEGRQRQRQQQQQRQPQAASSSTPRCGESSEAKNGAVPDSAVASSSSKAGVGTRPAAAGLCCLEKYADVGRFIWHLERVRVLEAAAERPTEPTNTPNTTAP